MVLQATHYFSDNMDSNSVDSILPWLVEPEGTGGPTLLYSISSAIDIKACSTLVAFLAEVSRNGMPNWSAHSCNNLKSEIFQKFVKWMFSILFLISVASNYFSEGARWHFGARQFEVWGRQIKNSKRHPLPPHFYVIFGLFRTKNWKNFTIFFKNFTIS